MPYTDTFFSKKMFIFMGFFHWYGFGMVPGLNLCIYFSQKCAREAHFWPKQMHRFCPGTKFLCIHDCEVVKIRWKNLFTQFRYWTCMLVLIVQNKCVNVFREVLRGPLKNNTRTTEYVIASDLRWGWMKSYTIWWELCRAQC